MVGRISFLPAFISLLKLEGRTVIYLHGYHCRVEVLIFLLSEACWGISHSLFMVLEGIFVDSYTCCHAHGLWGDLGSPFLKTGGEGTPADRCVGV